MTRTALLLAPVVLLALTGCRNDGFVSPVYSRVSFVSPPAEGTPGWLLDDELEVVVRRDDGETIAGVWVHWWAATPGALFSADSSLTDSGGFATVDYAPGWDLGPQRVEARAQGEVGATTVTATGMAFEQVEVFDRSCGIDAEGRMWCWPLYSNEVHPKRLDDTRRPVHVHPSMRFTAIRTLTYVSNDRFALCAITTDGELWCARASDFMPFSASPGPSLHHIPTPGPIIDMALGGSSGRTRCIIDTDNRAWCAGENSLGQLGDGTRTSSETWQPVQGDHRFAEITVGKRDACAIDLSGRPWCWGDNFHERLGISPSAVAITTPTPVDGDIRISRITQASNGLCGLSAHGTPTLLCWGPTFAAARLDLNAPSGIVGIPTTATTLAGDVVGGRIVHDGRLHRFGYNGGNVADFQFFGTDMLEPTITGVVRLVSRTSYYWCIEHEGGATICSERFDRPVAVPMPSAPSSGAARSGAPR